MARIISPICIDLGGKHTGVSIVQYHEGEDPSHEADSRGFVLTLPSDGDKMTWQQSGRTQRRHMVRAGKRRKLAKRLLRLIVSEAFGMQPTTKQWERLNGLLNRRGYTRLEAESDLSALDEVTPDFFAEQLPNQFTNVSRLSVQFDDMLQAPALLTEILETPLFKAANKREFKKLVPRDWPEDRGALSDAWQAMKFSATQLLDELHFGHKHRSDYLKAIKAEIASHPLLQDLGSSTVGAEDLWRVIGHISNLQLRVLRRYFNDVGMKTGDRWLPDKLHQQIERWIRGWHPGNNEERTRRHALLRRLKETPDTIQFLFSITPRETIPPYEDQNNRRPPKDMTLLLSPDSLDHQFPRWRIWTSNLMSHNPGIDDQLGEIIQHTDRSSRPEPKCRKQAYILQRVMDRNSRIDPYGLRLLTSSSGPSHAAADFKTRLERDLGPQHLNQFLRLATNYYRESRRARQGLWIASAPRNLLERSDLNPPRKQKLLHILVGNILGMRWDHDAFNAFVENYWNHPVVGRSTPRTLARSVEKARKARGNLFNAALQRDRYRIELKGEKLPLDKEIWKAWKQTQTVADYIADSLDHGVKHRARYRNPFSIAQLYNLIETDLAGFSRTSLAVHLENRWRMESVQLPDAKECANASRLVADSARPFDGMLGRMLDRQAWEIAKRKVEQIHELSPTSGTTLYIPVFVEENRFAFSLGMQELKKRNRLKKQLNDMLAKQEDRWKEKWERIREDSHDICPYTGNPIGQQGEYDHIIPRAYSRKERDTVFNSEFNLIWCSRAGNQNKGEQRYTLLDLHNSFLQWQFGTIDRKQIEQNIETSFRSLPDGIPFEELKPQQRLALRHALFLPRESPVFERAFQLLATQQKSRVNGTQAWLIKRVFEHLESQLADWSQDNNIHIELDAARLDAEQVHGLRLLLASHDPKLAKADVQAAASHIVDALCVFAAAIASPGWGSKLALPEVFAEDPVWLKALLPDHLGITTIERTAKYRKQALHHQKLFKDGIYAEHFLPVWLTSEGLRFGYDSTENSVPLQKGNSAAWFGWLKPFLRFHQRPVTDEYEFWQNEAVDSPVYYTIDKTAAFEHLHRVAKQPHSDEDVLSAEILEGISYLTQKQNITSRLYNEAKGEFATQNAILNAKSFTVNLNTKLGTRGELGRVKGKLSIPARTDWERLLHHPLIHHCLGTKPDHRPDFGFWSRLFEAFFPRRQPDGTRPKSRRVYSLPTIPSPSGELFRVKRRSPDGRSTFQLIASNGTASLGLAQEGDQISFKGPVPLPHLRDSPNLAPRKGRFTPATPGVVKFDQWRQLLSPTPSIDELWMAPGTLDRAYLRIKQPFHVLQTWIGPTIALPPEDPLDLQQHDGNVRTSGKRIALPPEDPLDLQLELRIDSNRFAANHQIALLGKPRSNLFILTVSKTVDYWYIVNSTSSAMRDAYQAATESI